VTLRQKMRVLADSRSGPGEDFAIPAFAALFLMIALSAVVLTRRVRAEI